MNKTIKIYAVIFAIVLAILALLEINRNEVVDWRKNYDTAKKTPFGLYVFDKEANSIFGNHLIKINESPYDYYNEKTEKKPHNILIIEQNIDGESWNKIFSHISKGSDAMVVSEYFSPKLIDTLGIWASNISYEDNQIFKLTDKKFSKDTLIVDKLPSRRGFSEISANTEILGVATDKETKQQPNFIKVKYGKGNVYLHADPLFLTNYYLLKKGNKTYFQDVFSYLPNRETLWFTEETSASAPSSSILRVVLANPPLKYAWWLFLAGLLLFTFFNAKRKQRIVPIVEPLKNKSVEFVKSVGNLYLQEGDFRDMMTKKAQYFLHKVRTDLLLDTRILDENFAKKLQLKTGKPIEKINEAVILLQKSQDQYAFVTREDLVKMNRLLDEIYN